MTQLERAIEIATRAHQGQKDKAGNDYNTPMPTPPGLPTKMRS